MEIALDEYGRHYQIRDERLTAVIVEKKFFEPQSGMLVIYDESGNPLGASSMQERSGLGVFWGQRHGDQPALNFAKKLFAIKIYDRIHAEIWSPIRIPKVSKGETILDEDGGNLVGVLHQLAQTQKEFLSELNSLLKILFDDIVKISFPHNEKGEILIRWEDANGRVANTTQLSDGTLKFLCLTGRK